MKSVILPKISVIVPCYNVEQYLDQCLESLLNQTMKDIEMICVNDGSKDNTLKILQKYATKDERIVLLDQPNEGVSVARNNALEHVRGEYFMFVDSDDWLDLETCKTVYDVIIKEKAQCLMFSYTKEFECCSVVAHIFSDNYIVWKGEEVQRNFHRKLVGPIGKELSIPQDADLLASCGMQLFETKNGIQQRFVDIRKIGTFEDGLYQIMLYKDCKRFVYIDKPFYHYRKTNSNSITTKYNPLLFAKWQHLYDIIADHIQDWNKDATYTEALNNKIAIGVIGLGLNQVHAGKGLFAGGKSMKEMLSTPRYRKCISNLDISLMPIAWKIFFFLAKYRLTVTLYAMLTVIEYLRTHKK